LVGPDEVRQRNVNRRQLERCGATPREQEKGNVLLRGLGDVFEGSTAGPEAASPRQRMISDDHFGAGTRRWVPAGYDRKAFHPTAGDLPRCVGHASGGLPDRDDVDPTPANFPKGPLAHEESAVTSAEALPDDDTGVYRPYPRAHDRDRVGDGGR